MNNNTRIMMLLQEKINQGQIDYKQDVPLDGSRDNLKEALDETLDLCVYLAATVLELHDKYKKFEAKDNPPDKLPF
mgnify:FL=1|jgi:hypothetical protein|tara:strand:- start:1112 stop:1339 length:228 start_codon:yes stop_codon:yes gene_type:complete